MISDELTPRELEVAKLICDGNTAPQIATKLIISVRTVESHRTNIFSKLQIEDKRDLVSYMKGEFSYVSKNSTSVSDCCNCACAFPLVSISFAC